MNFLERISPPDILLSLVTCRSGGSGLYVALTRNPIPAGFSVERLSSLVGFATGCYDAWSGNRRIQISPSDSSTRPNGVSLDVTPRLCPSQLSIRAQRTKVVFFSESLTASVFEEPRGPVIGWLAHLSLSLLRRLVDTGIAKSRIFLGIVRSRNAPPMDETRSCVGPSRKNADFMRLPDCAQAALAANPRIQFSPTLFRV